MGGFKKRHKTWKTSWKTSWAQPRRQASWETKLGDKRTRHPTKGNKKEDKLGDEGDKGNKKEDRLGDKLEDKLGDKRGDKLKDKLTSWGRQGPRKADTHPTKGNKKGDNQQRHTCGETSWETRGDKTSGRRTHHPKVTYRPWVEDHLQSRL